MRNALQSPPSNAPPTPCNPRSTAAARIAPPARGPPCASRRASRPPAPKPTAARDSPSSRSASSAKTAATVAWRASPTAPSASWSATATDDESRIRSAGIRVDPPTSTTERWHLLLERHSDVNFDVARSQAHFDSLNRARHYAPMTSDLTALALSPAEFCARVIPVLSTREAENGLPIGIALRLAQRGGVGSPALLLSIESRDTVVGAAVWTQQDD